MDQTEKNILVVGATGVGKSFLLNLLLGSEVGFSDEYFIIGETQENCTQICSAKTGTLFGKEDGIKVNLIDMPGLYDTRDHNEEKTPTEMPSSVKHLINLEQFIGENYNFHIHRVLVCLDVLSKFDERPKHLLNISDILMPSKDQIAIVLTKCNQTKLWRQEKRESLYQNWKDKLNGMGFQKIYFFGLTLSEVDIGLENDIKEAMPTTMRGWTQLTKEEQYKIAIEFKIKVDDPSCIAF